MANSKAGLGVSHSIVDLNNADDVLETLHGLIDMDNDLVENEDYFRPDTISLGYESEADRIVQEYISANGFPKTFKAFEKACFKITDAISEQEYYGVCDLSLIDLGGLKTSLVFAYGGSYDT